MTAFEVGTVTVNPAIDQTVTISNFTAGKVNRVEQTRADPGGKGVNVASILADVGHSVAVTGFLGRDNATPFEDLFARKRIVDRFVRIPGQTRVGIKVSDPVLGQTTDINFPGQPPREPDITALVASLQDLDAEWFVLSGSLPPGVDPAFYRLLVETLHARGRKVLLDTSGAALRLALELNTPPDVIKPNLNELEELVGHPIAPGDERAMLDAVGPLQERGVSLIVVSMGSDGAWFIAGSTVLAARPPSVNVRSTVGAGDAMVAGIISAQLRRASLSECARMATAFAANAITHVGSGLSSPTAFHDLLPRVQLLSATGVAMPD